MPTYIDESGDTGVGHAAADEFRLAAVWFETIEHAAACGDAIAAVRRANGWRADYMFHWCETPPDRRRAFFRGVAEQNFLFASCTIDKRQLARSGVELTSELVAHTAASQLAALREYYHIAEVTKDAPLNERVWVGFHNNAGYLGAIRAGFMALRSARKPNAPLVKKVKPARPAADSLVQLADMVCGAVGHHAMGQSECYRLVQGKRISLLGEG